MTKGQKIALGAGALAIIALVAFYFWKKRWQTFTNIGNSQWLPTRRNDGRLALRMESDNHMLKAGDKIEIEHNHPDVLKGETTVVDVVTKNGYVYVVTALDASPSNPDITGKVRWKAL